MFLHAQSTISHCCTDSFHSEIRIQTKHRRKMAPLKSSPGEKCLNLERHCCDCSALDYSGTFWPAHVKFNDKGLFFQQLEFFIIVSGRDKKVCFSDQWESWKQTLEEPRRTCVCINAWWDHVPACVDVLSGRLSINGRNSHSFYVEWQGFSFLPLFFWVGRSKDPHTIQ